LLALLSICFYASRPLSPYHDAAMTVTVSAGLTMSTLQALSALSRISVQWPEPLRSLKVFFSLFIIQLDITVIRPGCIFKTNNSLFVYIMSLLLYPTFAVLLSMAMGVAKYVFRRDVDFDRFCNAHGLALMVAYLSVIVISVLPFQCQFNPDKSLSVAAYRDVLCWEDGHHGGMVGFAVVATLLFVVGFLAVVTWATLALPWEITKPGGVRFVLRFQFIFARFIPERYYYALVFALRNLLIGLIPLLLVNAPQVQFFLLAIVIVGHTALQCRLWPWRAPMANALDAGFGVTLTLFIVGGSMMGDFDMEQTEEVTQGFLVTGIILAAIGTLAIIAFCLAKAMLCHRKFFIFISHHKVGAALLARWLKLILQDEGVHEVFLDSDNVTRLDRLINIVAYECDNIVVLLTSQTLSRPWCAMEIAAAHKAGTNIVPVTCDDFSGISDEFLSKLNSIWNDEQKAMMINAGVRLLDVYAAYTSLQDISPVRLTRDGANMAEHRRCVTEVLDRCTGWRGTMRQLTSSSNIGFTGVYQLGKRVSGASGMHDAITILGDVTKPEASCACRVLQAMLQSELQRDVAIAGEDPSRLAGCSCLLVVLTPGILERSECASTIVEAYEKRGELVPLLVGEAFDFPDTNFYMKLSKGEIIRKQDLDTDKTEAAYRKLFNMLALTFTGHGSSAIQTTEIRSIATRVRVLLADARAGEDRWCHPTRQYSTDSFATGSESVKVYPEPDAVGPC